MEAAQGMLWAVAGHFSLQRGAHVNLQTPLRSAAVFVAATLLAPALARAQALDASLPGKAVFDGTCATCHAAPAEVRVPTMAALAAMPAAQIRDAMNDGGKMAELAASLSAAQRAQVVAYLTSAQTAAAARWADTIMCAADKRAVDVNQARRRRPASASTATRRAA